MSLRTTIIGIAVSPGFTRAFRAVLVAAALIAALAGLARAQSSRLLGQADISNSVHPNAITHGNNPCDGTGVGQLPGGDCPAGAQSWGQPKYGCR